ncbi:MAG TPA: protein kinase [Thermoanaerobaculia bacterium]
MKNRATEFVGKTIQGYELREPIGAGKKGFAMRAYDPLSANEVVCKFYDRQRIDAGWENEIRKINQLKIPQVVGYLQHTVEVIDGVEYICIFYEYIPGQNLAELVETSPETITLSFVETFLTTMLTALFTMKRRAVVHGDIHAKNIMWSPPDADVYGDRMKFKLIDFGLASERNDLTPRDDFKQIALVAGRLMAAIERSTLSPAQAFFYDELFNYFLRILAEQDKTRLDKVGDPEHLLKQLDEIRLRYVSDHVTDEAESLSDPFSYLNAEQIRANSPLLRALYSDNFPGFNDLYGNNNVILSGPRGCGKTMIFRNMHFGTKLRASNVSADKLETWVGFYVHSQHLYFAFHFRPARRDSHVYDRLIPYYFYLVLAEEVLATLLLAEVRIGEAAVSIENRAAGLLQLFTESFVHFTLPPEGAHTLRHLYDFVMRERKQVRQAIDREEGPAQVSRIRTGDDFLIHFCRELKVFSPLLRSRQIFFLLDDYSMPMISSAVQRRLNPIIFYRGPEYNFKVSAENESVFLFADRKRIEASREYIELDLGLKFLDEIKDTATKANFIREIVNNRLTNTSGVACTELRDILGETPFSWSELARQIREDPHRAKYFGLDVVAELCTGDISVILDLIRQIVTAARVREGFDLTVPLTAPIDAETQDITIKNFSQAFFDNFASQHPDDERLRRIVGSFGNLSHWYVRNRTSLNEGVEVPFQCTRIEIIDDGELRDEREIYFALLRHCGFVRISRGRSQRGTLSRRLFLRRIFVPAFLLSFSRRDSIRWTTEQFRQFIVAPDDFADRYKRSPQPSAQMKIGFENDPHAD